MLSQQYRENWQAQNMRRQGFIAWQEARRKERERLLESVRAGADPVEVCKQIAAIDGELAVASGVKVQLDLAVADAKDKTTRQAQYEQTPQFRNRQATIEQANAAGLALDN
ncbi:MAG: hypothetical protein L0322_25315 [Chloroflexi bacterium]|nr:hypothetical protein [Chloroflexota bacterium]MCI0644954.1 hypothetical protein [Chloroflexota bacterium]